MHKLNDIIPPSRRREAESLNQPAAQREESPRFPAARLQKFPYTTLISVAVVIVVSIGALLYFSSAKIEVTPHTVSAEVRGSFTATKSSGDLPFEIITAQKIASQSIKGSGTKAVSAVASGAITIYNQQSAAQRLVANTRFATASGLIFRIRSAVTIPGGSAAKPGSVAAKVYADQAGSTYNIASTSFTVPGLAGTLQADKVYARSTSAMTGGALGNTPVVDAALEAQARSALATVLAPDLAKSLEKNVRPGYILLPGAATTIYEVLASEPSSETGMVDVKEQGIATAVVFSSAALARVLALSMKDQFPSYQNEPLAFTDASKLVLSPENGIPDQGAELFSFTLSGTAGLVYTIDQARIATAASGKTREAASVALSSYPEVKSAFIKLSPFWRQTFPQDPAAISVIVRNP